MWGCEVVLFSHMIDSKLGTIALVNHGMRTTRFMLCQIIDMNGK